MKISIVRSGGFAGLVQRHEIELERLPHAARSIVEKVITPANLNKLASSASPQLGADRFTYRISCDDEDHIFEVVLHEATLTAELRKVIEILIGHPRQA